MSVATFTAGGHEWRVEIGLGSLRRLRTEAGFDLSKGAAEEGIAAAMMSDPVTVGKALWVLCRDQAAARGITTVEDFFDLFPAPADFEAPCAALGGAVVDFFLPGRATEFKKKLPGLTAKLNAAAEAAVAAADSTSNNSAGGSPGSPASTAPA